MKAGIIGPSKIEYLQEIGDKSAEEVKALLTQIVEIVINNNLEIVITPDKNSPLEFIGKKYSELNGGKIYEVLPLDDKEFGYKEWVNIGLGETINCGTWRNQPEKTNDETELLICIGYGVGVLCEIAYAKWFKPKPVLIINELVSEKLPFEINKSLDIHYVSIDDLDEELKSLLKKFKIKW